MSFDDCPTERGNQLQPHFHMLLKLVKFWKSDIFKDNFDFLRCYLLGTIISVTSLALVQELAGNFYKGIMTALSGCATYSIYSRAL